MQLSSSVGTNRQLESKNSELEENNSTELFCECESDSQSENVMTVSVYVH